MAEITADRVYETSTTTGTGSYTLAGAISGYRAFSAVCANADTVRCFVEEVDANGVPNGGWEVGIYTWGTGGVLARTTIEASSNANAAVSWAAGTRRIGLGVTASKLASTGLANTTEAISTSSPNATINIVSLTVTGGSTNAGLALVPKGTAGISASVPDSTTTGGNVRGTRSIDWQLQRNAADNVAGATGSVISGGVWNKISTSADYSVMAGGFQNTINSGGGTLNIIGGGTLNSITSTSGKNTILGGESNSISAGGSYNLAHGYTVSITTGESSSIFGRQSSAGANYSFVTGYYAVGRTTSGSRIHACGRILNAGDAQYERYVLSRATTNATPTDLTATQGAAGTTAIPVLSSGSAMAVTGTVVARNVTNGDSASWSFSGMLKNVSGTVSMVGTPTVTSIAADSSLSAASIALSADNTNKGLLITATGIAATSMRWVATVHASFVG